MKSEKKVAYIRIKQELEEMIQQGRFKVGEKLPSETDMAKFFQVSRETFRSSIRLLEEEGKVVVKRGVGTFITNSLPTIPYSLETLIKITDIIKNANLVESDEVNFTKTLPCTSEWAEKLRIEQNEDVIYHERLRTANDEPVVCSQNIIPRSLAQDIFDGKKITGSLTEFLATEGNIHISISDTELVVPLHTDPLSQKLLIYPQTTVLLMKQVHYDDFNQPVMYSCDYFRNDIFKFHLRRTKSK